MFGIDGSGRKRPLSQSRTPCRVRRELAAQGLNAKQPGVTVPASRYTCCCSGAAVGETHKLKLKAIDTLPAFRRIQGQARPAGVTSTGAGVLAAWVTWAALAEIGVGAGVDTTTGMRTDGPRSMQRVEVTAGKKAWRSVSWSWVRHIRGERRGKKNLSCQISTHKIKGPKPISLTPHKGKRVTKSKDRAPNPSVRPFTDPTQR